MWLRTVVSATPRAGGDLRRRLAAGHPLEHVELAGRQPGEPPGHLLELAGDLLPLLDHRRPALRVHDLVAGQDVLDRLDQVVERDLRRTARPPRRWTSGPPRPSRWAPRSARCSAPGSWRPARGRAAGRRDRRRRRAAARGRRGAPASAPTATPSSGSRRHSAGRSRPCRAACTVCPSSASRAATWMVGRPRWAAPRDGGWVCDTRRPPSLVAAGRAMARHTGVVYLTLSRVRVRPPRSPSWICARIGDAPLSSPYHNWGRGQKIFLYVSASHP